MTARRFTCANCAAFRATDVPMAGVPTGGDCRRRSPSLVKWSAWPRVRSDDWCLEYVADQATAKQQAEEWARALGLAYPRPAETKQ